VIIYLTIIQPDITFVVDVLKSLYVTFTLAYLEYCLQYLEIS